MKVLITGGAGFIGSHLAVNLLARGHSVVCVDDLSRGSESNLSACTGHENFSFVKQDIMDLNAMVTLSAGVDCIAHLASLKIPRYSNAYQTLIQNVQGAKNVLECCRQNGAKLVFASTSDVYGKSPDLPFQEDGDLLLGPSTSRRWAYAVTKLYDEYLTLAYRDEYDLKAVILRFFGAYGPGQYLNWWGGPQGVFLDLIEKDLPIEIHGDGRQTRCFIYVKELAEGIARAIERDEAIGEIINLGTDEEVSILDLARLMYETSGIDREERLTFISYESMGGNYQDVVRRVPDLTRMERILGLSPKVKLREGLTELWTWFRETSEEK